MGKDRKVGCTLVFLEQQPFTGDEARRVLVLVNQSCPTLCNSTAGSSPPGSYVSGIPQARGLEWVATSSSRLSSQARDRTQVSCIRGQILYHLS